MEGKFKLNKTYYTGNVYEWNLPTGTTCPFALECKVVVDRHTGKFNISRGQYKCYAASAERFPAVRKRRWENFEFVLKGNKPVIPKDCEAIRIHSSGDFFNQQYFDMWLDLAERNPTIEFWAYTKSLTYWVNRLEAIPENFVLTASYGGKHDHLIDKHKLKNVIVYARKEDVPPDRPIDFNDDWARKHRKNFALLDNLKNSKQKQKDEYKKNEA